MPADNRVLCSCCQQWITRQREREHRRLAAQSAPYKLSASETPSRRAGVTDSDLDDSGSEQSTPPAPYQPSNTPESPSNIDIGVPSPEMDFEDDFEPESTVTNFRPATGQFWVPPEVWKILDDDEHSSDEESGDEEDPDRYFDEEAINWNVIDGVSGLTPWDQLGEEYEREAAEIDSELAPYDLATCRAFAYKLITNTTDPSKSYHWRFHKILPSQKSMPCVHEWLSLLDSSPKHMIAVSIHVSVLSGLIKMMTSTFTYLPLIPRLLALLANPKMADQLLYRHKFEHVPGTMSDVFDGDNYQELRTQYVTVNAERLKHKFFEDARDIAIGLSTDGFAPFKRRKSTAWPLLAFLYNLPPDLRFLVGHYLSLGVIPGPKKPHNVDSFLWPFVQEMLRLAHGVRAYDSLKKELFLLHAYLILVFGDMPAVAMLMRMKGHNGISPCRMCEIKGVRVPESRATTHYVPLDQTSFAAVQENPSRTHTYDPLNLPLRTHKRFLEQAAEIDHCTTNVAAEALAKESGIKGTPLLSILSSLSFPHSFPHDFMHLMWENTLDNLLDHWTGTFKGLDDGVETYQFEKTVWDAIGEATAASGSTIPSAYGARVLNVSKDRTYFSAEMISLWTMYIAPVVLRRHFTRPRYYEHFVQLVQIIIVCLQFEITDEEIEGVRQDMVKWVKEYESIYYQHDPTRVSACPVTIHALLHIADSIKFAGPVWCYWAFPMERYCGQLQPAIKSRRFPYASLDRHVTETAQLSQIKVIYDVSAELSLNPTRGRIPGSFSIPEYDTVVLLPPKSPIPPQENLRSIAAALATRYHVNITAANACLKACDIQVWGRARRVDSTEGDTFRASGLGSRRDDTRDASFVRYEMLVDKNAHRARQKAQYEAKTFYGQLQLIYVLRIPLTALRLIKEVSETPITLILVGIRRCNIDEAGSAAFAPLDVHLYTTMGQFDVIDITSVQCVVGRLKAAVDDREWAIIDRSGSLARAVFDAETDD